MPARSIKYHHVTSQESYQNIISCIFAFKLLSVLWYRLTCHCQFLDTHREAGLSTHFCNTGPGSPIHGGGQDQRPLHRSCRCWSCPSRHSPVTSCSLGCRCKRAVEGRSRPCSPRCSGSPHCACPSREAPAEVPVPFHL